MNLDLADEETAALLRELDSIIDGDRYFLSPRIKTPKGDPRQAEAGAGSPAFATPAESIRATASDRAAETTARRAVSNL